VGLPFYRCLDDWKGYRAPGRSPSTWLGAWTGFSEGVRGTERSHLHPQGFRRFHGHGFATEGFSKPGRRTSLEPKAHGTHAPMCVQRPRRQEGEGVLGERGDGGERRLDDRPASALAPSSLARDPLRPLHISSILDRTFDLSPPRAPCSLAIQRLLFPSPAIPSCRSPQSSHPLV